MFLHGAGEMQLCGDLVVGDALGYEPEYVGLPVGDAEPGPAAGLRLFQQPAAPQRQRLDPVPGEHAGRCLQPLPRLAPAVLPNAGPAAQSRARSAQTG